MRKFYKEVGGVLQSEHPRQEARCTLPRLAADPLTLPRVERIAPTLNVGERVDPRFGQVALNLLRLGRLTEEDARHTIPRLVEIGLTRWLESVVTTSDRAYLATIGGTIDLGANAVLWNELGAPESNVHIGLAFAGVPDEVIVGPTLMQLESILAGLGQTVAAVMENAAARTFGAWTPCRADAEASYIYWQGAVGQAEWEEEMEGMYGPTWREEMEEGEWYSPEDFHGSIGCDWICRPRVTVPVRKLRKLARRHPLAWVRRLCAIIQHAAELLKRPNALSGMGEFDQQSVYPAAVLRWSGQDDTARVLDDFINMANESSDCFTDYVALWEIPNDMEGFVRWEEATRTGLRLYQLFCEAVVVIAEHDQEIRNG